MIMTINITLNQLFFSWFGFVLFIWLYLIDEVVSDILLEGEMR